jgi:hypothetical protein
MRTKILVGAVLVALGCGGEKRSAAPAPSSSPAPVAAPGSRAPAPDAPGKPKFRRVGDDSIYEMTTTDFKHAKDKLAKNDDPTTDCVYADSLLDNLKDEDDPQVVALVADVRQFCEYDAPLVVVAMRIDQITAAKLKDPNDAAIGQCAEIMTDLAALDRAHAEDPKVKDLHERTKTVCPTPSP